MSIKRITALFLGLSIVILFAPYAWAEAPHAAYIDNCVIAAEGGYALLECGQLNVKPRNQLISKDGDFLLDMETMAKTLGCLMSTEDGFFSVSRGGGTVSGIADSNKVSVNGVTRTLTGAVSAEDGVLYAPAELFVYLGLDVFQYPEYHLVSIGAELPKQALQKRVLRLFGIYVSPDGDDNAPGYPYAPVKTIGHAKALVRSVNADINSFGLATNVFLGAGGYHPFTLETADSGTPDYPIHYRSLGDGKVSISNSVSLLPSLFTLSDDGRIPDSAANNVYVADLSGIIPAGQYPVQQQSRIMLNYFQIYEDGEQQQLARYPNSGWLTTGAVLQGETGKDEANIPKFKYTDVRHETWTNALDAVLEGYMGYYWSFDGAKLGTIDAAAKTVTLDRIMGFGVAPNMSYYATNLLEELDVPGEWYIESATKKLYYYPKNSLNNIEIVYNASNLVTIDGVSHIVLDGLTIENGRNYGIKINNSSELTIQNCVIRGIGTDAVYTTESRGITVDRCQIYNVGGAGVRYQGTSRDIYLEPQNNVVENCEIYNFQNTFRVALGGIVLNNGVGNIARHNVIHDSPHSGIYFQGNDHAVEYNNIYKVLKESVDSGAIYTCPRNYTARGTSVKNNYIHNIPNDARSAASGHMRMAIYLDDAKSGVEVTGNVVYRVVCAAMIGGGSDNIYENNIAVDCEKGVQFDARAISGQWQHWSVIPGGQHYENTINVLGNPLFNAALWYDRYPALERFVTMLNNYANAGFTGSAYDVGAPRNNIVRDNIFSDPRSSAALNQLNPKYLNVAQAFMDYGEYATPNVYTQNFDIGFVDKANGDFTLRQDAVVFDDIPGFEPIPFSEIGISALDIPEPELPIIGGVYAVNPVLLDSNHNVVTSLSGMRGQTITVKTDYVNIPFEQVSDYNLFIAFKNDNELLGIYNEKGALTSSVLAFSQEIEVPMNVDSQTCVEMYFWGGAELVTPLCKKIILPEMEQLILNRPVFNSDTMNIVISGGLTSGRQGESVVLRILNAGYEWKDVADNAAALQKLDQTVTDGNGRFAFDFEINTEGTFSDREMKIYVDCAGKTFQGYLYQGSLIYHVVLDTPIFDPKTMRLTVSGELGTGTTAEPIILRVLNAGYEWADVAENDAVLQKIDQTLADGNGRFVFDFEVNTAGTFTNGEMKIYVDSMGKTFPCSAIIKGD